MSDATVTPKKSGLYTFTVVLSSLVIAVPIFVGRLVEGILDTSNPAGVDVTQPLAYLSEILAWGFGSLGIVLIAIIVLLIVLYRRSRTFQSIALPLLILAVQVVVGLVTLLLSGLAD